MLPVEEPTIALAPPMDPIISSLDLWLIIRLDSTVNPRRQCVSYNRNAPGLSLSHSGDYAVIAFPDIASRMPPKAADESKRRSNTRRKVALACDSCREKKIRCDGHKPICGPCTRRAYRIDQCVYNSDNARSASRDE